MNKLTRQLVALIAVFSLLAQSLQAQQPQRKTAATTKKAKIQKNAVLKFTLLDALDSGTSKVGDLVHLQLARPLIVDGATLLQEGHTETGHIKKITAAGPAQNGIVRWSVDKVHFDDGSTAHAKFWFAGPEPTDVPDRYTKPAPESDGTGEAIAGLTEAVILAPITVPLALFHLPSWIYHKATEKPEPRNMNNGLEYHLAPGAAAAIVITEDHRVRVQP